MNVLLSSQSEKAAEKSYRHDTAAQAGDAYHQTEYASLNLIYQFHKRLSIGVETLYGHRETKDGSDGDVVRFTAGLVSTIFD